ncbi:MAG TPA: ABC transporter substrate-binding protein [Candidatus Thermoplasmatota archaeon]|nr:ABC transporter substrate-binding protein [Candidatus Thermoplasmatota archaeon]
MRRTARVALPLALLLATLAGCVHAEGSDGLRLGYFPNVTHAQALYGVQAGLYAEAMGNRSFEAVQFNAGPHALEALLAGQVDATYVGPSPVISALAKTGDGMLRVVAGAASGGARFIVRSDVQLGGDADYAGKAFASPQLGNTQDISLKDFLRQRGHTTTDRGGDVQVINAAGPDILTLFLQKRVDGAWVPEPWATRLERDGGGRELVDERDLWPGGRFATTLLVTSARYLERHPDRVRALLEAHVQATDAVAAGGEATLQAINDGMEAATGKSLPMDLLRAASTQINFTNDPLPASLAAFGDKARGLSLLRDELPPLARVVALDILNEVLARHGRAGVSPP